MSIKNRLPTWCHSRQQSGYRSTAEAPWNEQRCQPVYDKQCVKNPVSVKNIALPWREEGLVHQKHDKTRVQIGVCLGCRHLSVTLNKSSLSKLSSCLKNCLARRVRWSWRKSVWASSDLGDFPIRNLGREGDRNLTRVETCPSHTRWSNFPERQFVRTKEEIFAQGELNWRWPFLSSF